MSTELRIGSSVPTSDGGGIDTPLILNTYHELYQFNVRNGQATVKERQYPFGEGTVMSLAEMQATPNKTILDEIYLAWIERQFAAYATIPVTLQPFGTANGLDTIQAWLEANCTSWVDHVSGPVNGGNTDFLYFTLDTWRAAAGFDVVGGVQQGFRRSTDGVTFSYGLMQPGDWPGWWVYEDLQKGLSALRWKSSIGGGASTETIVPRTGAADWATAVGDLNFQDISNWEPANTYNTGDKVQYSNGFYASLVDGNTGIVPYPADNVNWSFLDYELHQWTAGISDCTFGWLRGDSTFQAGCDKSGGSVATGSSIISRTWDLYVSLDDPSPALLQNPAQTTYYGFDYLYDWGIPPVYAPVITFDAATCPLGVGKGNMQIASSGSADDSKAYSGSGYPSVAWCDEPTDYNVRGYSVTFAGYLLKFNFSHQNP